MQIQNLCTMRINCILSICFMRVSIFYPIFPSPPFLFTLCHVLSIPDFPVVIHFDFQKILSKCTSMKADGNLKEKQWICVCRHTRPPLTLMGQHHPWSIPGALSPGFVRTLKAWQSAGMSMAQIIWPSK